MIKEKEILLDAFERMRIFNKLMDSGCNIFKGFGETFKNFWSEN